MIMLLRSILPTLSRFCHMLSALSKAEWHQGWCHLREAGYPGTAGSLKSTSLSPTLPGHPGGRVATLTSQSPLLLATSLSSPLPKVWPKAEQGKRWQKWLLPISNCPLINSTEKFSFTLSIFFRVNQGPPSLSDPPGLGCPEKCQVNAQGPPHASLCPA